VATAMRKQILINNLQDQTSIYFVSNIKFKYSLTFPSLQYSELKRNLRLIKAAFARLD